METLYHLKQVLNAYAKDAEETYKRILIREGKPASGNLLNSVHARVKIDNEAEYEVVLELADYWKFVEGGSKGTETSPAGAVYKAHWPPVNALLDWIRVKPVIPRPVNGKLPSPNQLAYLIGRKIKTQGIAPVPAMEETIEQLNAKYLEGIKDALALDVRDYLYSTIRE